MQINYAQKLSTPHTYNIYEAYIAEVRDTEYNGC